MNYEADPGEQQSSIEDFEFYEINGTIISNRVQSILQNAKDSGDKGYSESEQNGHRYQSLSSVNAFPIAHSDSSKEGRRAVNAYSLYFPDVSGSMVESIRLTKSGGNFSFEYFPSETGGDFSADSKDGKFSIPGYLLKLLNQSL